jgi:hypothetical protein
MAEREYKKLAGRGRRKNEFFSWTTLWLGRDHLLQVDHTGYSEEYKRFYFADIQSITLQKTQRAPRWTIFFLIMISLGLALAVTLGLGANGSPAWLGFAISWTALFVIFALINFVRGPSCCGYIQTAVHQEQLPSLKRIKASHKALARLREKVAEAQGSMPPEEIRARLLGQEPATPPLSETPPA